MSQQRTAAIDANVSDPIPDVVRRAVGGALRGAGHRSHRGKRGGTFPATLGAIVGTLAGASALAIGALCVACLLASGVARASPTPTYTLGVTSDANWSSALYAVPRTQDDFSASSLAGWMAAGMQAMTSVDLRPQQPDGFRFDQDIATAWASFTEAANGFTVQRAYARLSGYYLDGSVASGAHNEVLLHHSLRVENLGSGSAFFNLVQVTHGTLVAGGVANAATAHAQEDTSFVGICTGCTDASGQALSVITGGWAGFASVSATDTTPTITVGGDWQGRTSAFSKLVDGFPDPVFGIELSSLLGSSTVFMAGGAVAEFDVDYRGLFDVDTDGIHSGFISIGEADFSHTGDLQWLAIDPDTGLPDPDVRVTLLGDVDINPNGLPSPAPLLLMLAALPLAVRRSAGTLLRPGRSGAVR